jgi:phosphate transport system substrate-binding protein
MNIKRNTKRSLLKDTQAVSPAIASLVLVVIAVIAAAGVGVITNTLNTQTGDQAEGKDLSVQGKIDAQGSTTVLPFALVAASTYMEDHPAVEISVSGGGSGHGKSMAIKDKVDIGMASSRADKEDILQEGMKGATIYETEVGKRMIVVIVNDGTAGTPYEYNISTSASGAGNINMTDLIALYESGTQIPNLNISKAFQRSDVSGTEEGFAKWLGVTDADNQLDSSAEAKVGNPGVWAAVKETDNSIGFVDFGFVSDTNYAATMNGTAPSAVNYDKYESESKLLSPSGKKTLTSMLYYYTYGVPSGATKSFIDYCLSTAEGEGQGILEDVGLIPLAA